MNKDYDQGMPQKLYNDFLERQAMLTESIHKHFEENKSI